MKFAEREIAFFVVPLHQNLKTYKGYGYFRAIKIRGRCRYGDTRVCSGSSIRDASSKTTVENWLKRLGVDKQSTAVRSISTRSASERGVKAGKIHSIGLSNFYEDDVDRMMKIATIKPAVLQNETHPYHQSRSVKEHIAKLGTILEAWAPSPSQAPPMPPTSPRTTTSSTSN